MNLRRSLLLINIFLTGLFIWAVTDIFLSWSLDKKWENRIKARNLKSKNSAKRFSKKPKKIGDYQAIVEADIFGTKKAVPKVPVKQKEIQATNLNLELKGTVVGENGESFAIIWDKKTRKQDLYFLNDFVQGAHIVRIMHDRVILSIEGRKEAMSMSYERVNPAASEEKPKTQKK